MNFKNVLLLGLASVSLAACSRVDPGHVGIKVNNWGSDAGVSSTALGVGTYYAGPGTSIYEYPVYTSTYTWSRATNEGEKANEEFSFADKNGLTVTADVAVSYHVDSSKAPILFQKYRTDMQGIVNGPLRAVVREAFNAHAGTLAVEEIYGGGRTKLLSDVQEDVRRTFKDSGLIVEQVYWASPIRVPDAIMKQINQKIANEQQALAAQAAVATAEANARARIADAEGRAKAMQVEASAISTNPQILQLRAIEKWDGKYPQYVGGGMPLPTLKAN